LGSGTHTSGGWITTFCAFTEKGGSRENKDYELDGIVYPTININEIPGGSAEVPYTTVQTRIDATGKKYRKETETIIVAGNMGMHAVCVDKKRGGDMLRNVLMWCVCAKKPPEVVDNHESDHDEDDEDYDSGSELGCILKDSDDDSNED
jgi:hypothetical protein